MENVYKTENMGKRRHRRIIREEVLIGRFRKQGRFPNSTAWMNRKQIFA